MTEITILSGKGGTGKTSVTTALASLADNTVFTDSDVEAADVFLIFEPENTGEYDYDSGSKAQIDQDKCTSCNTCYELCRFHAVVPDKENGYYIDPFLCEGCRLCERACPEEAIRTINYTENKWFTADSRFGPLIYARMGPGEENSGKLVSVIRNKAREMAKEHSLEYVINDGPPGIGCPVIASLTGTDKVLIITEPSFSGKHDMFRVIELCEKFNTEVYVVINKYDLNVSVTEEIEEELQKKNIKVTARLPFDELFTKAMIEKKNIIEYAPSSQSAGIIKKIWEEIN